MAVKHSYLTTTFKSQRGKDDCGPTAIWNACSYLNLAKPKYKTLLKECNIKGGGTTYTDFLSCILNHQLPFLPTRSLNKVLKSGCGFISFNLTKRKAHIVFFFKEDKRYYIVNPHKMGLNLVCQIRRKSLEKHIPKNRRARNLWFYYEGGTEEGFLEAWKGVVL